VIFVTVGTNGAAFDRLLSELDDIAPGEEVVVQRGPSRFAPTGSSCFDYLPFAEIDRLVGEARVVITHGGVGSTLVAIAAGHRPIVVPRLRAFGEAVDDHQLLFAQRLDRDGLVRCIAEPADVRAEVAAGPTRLPAPLQHAGPSSLVVELAEYIERRCLTRESESIAAAVHERRAASTPL